VDGVVDIEGLGEAAAALSTSTSASGVMRLIAEGGIR
jgi:hypothetical protein